MSTDNADYGVDPSDRYAEHVRRVTGDAVCVERSLRGYFCGLSQGHSGGHAAYVVGSDEPVETWTTTERQLMRSSTGVVHGEILVGDGPLWVIETCGQHGCVQHNGRDAQ